MEKQSLTRKELYELIWSLPIRRIAIKYSTTELEIKNACTKFNIPIPLAGHWQKLNFGKPVTIIPLPLALDEHEITLKVRLDREGKKVSELTPLKILQKEIEYNLGNKLDVPERLSNPDKSIISTRKIISGEIKYTDRDYSKIRSESLNINVSKELIPRALRIMDTLIKALCARGHIVDVSNNTIVKIKGQSISIGLREKTKRVKKESNSSWDSYDYLPVGILTIKVIERYSDKIFSDGKLPLEKQIARMIASFEMWANEMNEREERWRQDRIKSEKEEKIRQDFEKRQEKELAAFKNTLKKASRWHKAANLRNYIDQVESNAITNNTLTEDIIKWLEWARKKADWYDPFIEAADQLLCGLDKDTLTFKKESYY